MTDLKNAVVLITGAGGGFGQQLARQCSAAGSRLILTDVSLELLDKCASGLDQAGRQSIIQCLTANLATREGCEALVQQVEQTPDVLINNAGIAHFGRFDEVPAEQWERLMQVNLLAPMRLVSLFVPGMIARRNGHLVLLSSVAGWVGTAGLAAYSAAKFGLRGFGEALHEELAEYNIKVTAVYPFFSRTPILDSPRFGSYPNRALPDRMLSAPEDVISQVIRAIQRDQQHVFPDPTAKRLHLIKRFVPGLLPILNRQMGRQSEQTAPKN